MRADEAAWMARVEGVLASNEQASDRPSPLRSYPMDMVAVSLMRELSREGCVLPFADTELLHAIRELETRNPR